MTSRTTSLDHPVEGPATVAAAARRRARRSLQVPMWGGFLSALVVTLVGGVRGWPFATLPGAPWLYQFDVRSQPLRYLAMVVFYAGVVGMCASWVRLMTLAHSGRLRNRTAFGIFSLWSLPLLFSVPPFSGDVFVYYVDGQALARGYSLYEAGVSALGPIGWVHMVFPIWRDTTTMYGPVFMRLAQGIAMLVPDSVVAGVMLFRLVAVASLVLAGLAITKLSRFLGRTPVESVVFALLNPVTMLHLVGGAHNDATMLGLLFAGLAVGVAARRWPLRLLAVALCVAGSAFKVPAFAGVLVLGWIWAGEGSGTWRRIVGAALAGVAGAAVFEALTIATQSTWGWLHATNVPGLAHPMLSPANALALAFGGLVGAPYPVNTVTRDIATLASLVLGTWLIMRTGRRATVESILRAMGWALLGLAWLSPAVYPWYLTWGLMLVGTVGPGRMRSPMITTIVVVSFIIAPGGAGWLDVYGDWRRVLIAFATVGVMGYAVRRVLAIHDVRFTEVVRIAKEGLRWRSSRSVPSPGPLEPERAA